MYRQTRVFSVVLLCTATMAQIHAQSAENSLNELVQGALDRNREVLAVRQRVNETQGLLRQAGMRPTPTLEVTGATGRPLATVGEEEYSAGYFHPIELGGKRDKRVRVAELSLELARVELDERTRQLSFEIKTRAIDSLAQREKAAALDRLVRLNEEAYKLTEARVKEGDAAALDAQLLLVEQSRTEVQRASLLGKLEGEVVEIRRLVGLSITDPLPLGERLPEITQQPSITNLQELALKQRPDLRIGRLLDEQGEAEVALAQAQSSPNVTVSARYISRSGQFDDQYGQRPDGSLTLLRDKDNIVMVGISIPLFSGNRNKGNIEAAVARASSIRLRRQHLDATIPLEVEAAYRRFRAAQTTLGIFDRGVVEQSQKNLDIIRQSYELGQLRLLDVINEQRRLADTQLSYIDAKADLARAAIDLEKAIGGNLP